jgi:hypothetical protein
MIDRETAVESLSHQIASCVHLMLAHRHITVAQLKQRLTDLPTREPLDDPSVIDDLLAAKNPHAIQSSLLADIGYVMGFDWDFKVARLADEPAGSPQASGFDAQESEK